MSQGGNKDFVALKKKLQQSSKLHMLKYEIRYWKHSCKLTLQVNLISLVSSNIVQHDLPYRIRDVLANMYDLARSRINFLP